jgi:type III secretory pathway component EscT
MVRRVMLLARRSALLALALGMLRKIAFYDILPFLERDPTQLTWRFNAAFAITAFVWDSA